jgi:hypothetical protein
MARPERHDVDYFPFFVKQGKTLTILYNKFGLEGIGFFTNVMRFLAITPDHHYCIKNESDMMHFISIVGISDEKKAIDMIELMVKTDKLDKNLWGKYKVIVCPAFIESVKDAYKRRANEIITIEEIRAIYKKQRVTVSKINEKKGGSGVIVSENNTVTPQDAVFDDNNPQRREEKSKVKKRREEKSKEEENKEEFTAQCAASEKSITSFNSRKLELKPEQLILFNAAKVCFENSTRAKAMIFKDKSTSAMQMRKLKEVVVACTKIEPDMPADFLRTVLEHFRVMTNGKLKGKAEFTPRALATPWIWETVIGSLSDNDGVTQDLINKIKGLFK